MLNIFSAFRDDVDVDLILLESGELSKEDRKKVVEALLGFLGRFEAGADKIFALTSSEPAMIIYRRAIALWREMLLDLASGDRNVWTDLAVRPRGQRKYQRRMRMLTDDAARAYRMLRSIGAPTKEAAQSINEVIQSHAKGLKLPSFSDESLRKLARKIDHFDAETEKAIVARAIPNLATLDLTSLNKEQRRWAAYRPIARQVLFNALEGMPFASGKKKRI